MPIDSKISQVSRNVHTGLRSLFLELFTRALRWVSGFFFALTFALIAQELAKFGLFSLVLMTSTLLFLFLGATQKWSLLNIVLFDVFFILLGQLAKMYLLVAP